MLNTDMHANAHVHAHAHTHTSTHKRASIHTYTHTLYEAYIVLCASTLILCNTLYDIFI